jgi:coenzyme Q-binding protein COQ10
LRHHVSRTLSYTPEQLFALVGDVERYPEFVPWLTTLRTWNHRTEAPGVEVLDAEARVGFAVFKERFSTRVRRDASTLHIDVRLLSGPFRKLENHWRFFEDPTGARVEFDIDFAFKSRLLEALLTANFHPAVERLMTCFDARAAALYGDGKGAN